MYKESASRAQRRALDVQQWQEEQAAKDAATLQSKPSISHYAKSLPRLPSDVRFHRIVRPMVDKEMLSEYVRTRWGFAFS